MKKTFALCRQIVKQMFYECENQNKRRDHV
ncbi:hypothetical protein SAMN04490248_1162 [Salinihabitans flavidus]|uniref:Uncharacterized protein n=1 Tax=Salinihabitans flavidus TaxID=569882 RepID=A0A1H8TM30_9RHOB|nr:hypothetical protein SAMN04490248_1162 [Salinihabitans flavidus]